MRNNLIENSSEEYMSNYKVVEKFVSVNGEGINSGQLAVFIRFKGCNLNCTYCDTKWANEENAYYEVMTDDEILEYIVKTNISNVTLTGGEPLLQPNIEKLIIKLAENAISCEIETNGSIDIGNFRKKEDVTTSFTMDYKLPSSQMNRYMLMNNFKYIKMNDSIKFVVSSITDLKEAKKIIEDNDLIGRCNIFFSPVFGQIEPQEIVNFMIKENLNDIRLQLQIHKYIWNPNERGV